MFEHKGVKIEFNANTGKFFAEVKGETVETTSLAGMKKKIEKCDAFVEFSALVLPRWKSQVNRVKIVGISKPRGTRSWNNKEKWRDEAGNEHEYSIYVDTPENEAALLATIEMDARHSKAMSALQDAHKKEHEVAWAKVVELKSPEPK